MYRHLNLSQVCLKNLRLMKQMNINQEFYKMIVVLFYKDVHWNKI